MAPMNELTEEEEEAERLLTTREGTETVPREQAAAAPVLWKLAASTPSTHRTSKLLREVLTQILPVLLLTTAGAIFTGELLKAFQTWNVFIRIEELFILVPILLNLKGNLEMNLAARFSTSANIGELDLRRTRRTLILGNLALLQVQALFVSLLAGLLSFMLGMLSRRGVHHAYQNPVHKAGVAEDLRGGYWEAALLMGVSMLVAGVSSGVLGSFMTSLVVLSRRFRVNPDNVATPLASALGDLITLTLLGLISASFLRFMGTLLSTAVVILLLAAIVLNIIITYKNAYVRELLYVGWPPLFLAMLISSGSGLVLERYVAQYRGFALLAPVMTALAGGTGSIMTSRLTTSLHSSGSSVGTGWSMEEGLLAAAVGITTSLLLLFIGIWVWFSGQVDAGIAWLGVYFAAVVITIAASLLMAYYLTLFLWNKDYDPDVYCLPLLTSLIDVIGQLLLVAAFAITASKRVPIVSPEQATEAAGKIGEAMDAAGTKEVLGELGDMLRRAASHWGVR